MESYALSLSGFGWTARAPHLESWAARFQLAQKWKEHHPGKERQAHWQVLQREIERLLNWYQLWVGVSRFVGKHPPLSRN
jgi:hypothetical protein